MPDHRRRYRRISRNKSASVSRADHVTVVDKGRGVGGRMATRRLTSPDGAARIDHGAQYFTNYDPQFKPMLDEWLVKGIIKEWSKGFSRQTECRTSTKHRATLAPMA